MSVNVCPDDIFSVCPIVSAQYLPKRSTTFYQTWYCGVLIQGDVSCGKLVHCLECQGHSEGLSNQNMTVFTLFSKLLVCLQTDVVVQHHKPECPVEKWDYCVQGLGHSEGSKCY